MKGTIIKYMEIHQCWVPKSNSNHIVYYVAADRNFMAATCRMLMDRPRIKVELPRAFMYQYKGIRLAVHPRAYLVTKEYSKASEYVANFFSK